MPGEVRPKGHLAGACLVAALLGAGIGAAQKLPQGSDGATVLFSLWLTGPFIAGLVLRSAKLLPCFLPATVWFLVLPIAMLLGFMAPAGRPDDFRPLAVVVYLAGALPFIVSVAAGAVFLGSWVAILSGRAIHLGRGNMSKT